MTSSVNNECFVITFLSHMSSASFSCVTVLGRSSTKYGIKVVIVGEITADFKGNVFL